MTTNQRWIPMDPEYRAGLYKSIDQVPDHHRLRNYEHRYEGRDCWTEYIKENDLKSDDLSQSHRGYLERAERRWKLFIQRQGKHHALCTPRDANAYAEHLLDEYSLDLSTAATYWASIERFYRWMFYHAEYPHRYHPFVMAAVADETSCMLWHRSIEPNEK